VHGSEFKLSNAKKKKKKKPEKDRKSNDLDAK
jgi:hypothetical protein